MADTGSSKWTEAEKYQFLIQIIKQLTDSGAKIRLGELNMPGRTVKSMTHVLAKIKAEAATAYGGAGTSQPATPNKAKTSNPAGSKSGASTGKKRAAKGEPVADPEDDSEKDDHPTPSKRPRSGINKKSTKQEPKKEEEGEYDEDGFKATQAVDSVIEISDVSLEGVA